MVDLSTIRNNTDGLVWNVFGSEDSSDVDIMFHRGSINVMNLEGRRALVRDLKYKYGIPYLDPNVCASDINGNLRHVLKGEVDECNNMLFYTYGLHNQYGNPAIARSPMIRDIDSKKKRVIRGVLSYLSRTEHRKDVKHALKSYDRSVNYFSDFDLKKVTEINKSNASFQDYAKFVAFQVAQLHALTSGYEIYTKKDVVSRYPDLAPMIYYKEFDVSLFDEIHRMLMESISCSYLYFVGHDFLNTYHVYHTLNNKSPYVKTKEFTYPDIISEYTRLNKVDRDIKDKKLNDSDFHKEWYGHPNYLTDSVYHVKEHLDKILFDSRFNDLKFNVFRDYISIKDFINNKIDSLTIAKDMNRIAMETGMGDSGFK